MPDHSDATLPELMTAREVAAAARLEVDTVRKRARRGLPPKAVRLGGRLRFRRDEVRAWLEGSSS